MITITIQDKNCFKIVYTKHQLVLDEWQWTKKLCNFGVLFFLILQIKTRDNPSYSSLLLAHIMTPASHKRFNSYTEAVKTFESLLKLIVSNMNVCLIRQTHHHLHSRSSTCRRFGSSNKKRYNLLPKWQLFIITKGLSDKKRLDSIKTESAGERCHSLWSERILAPDIADLQVQ